MSTILDDLNTVLTNITNNRKQIADALANAESTAGTFSPDLAAAIDTVLAAFPDPRIAAQMLTARAQIEQLSKTAGEMVALIAAMQVVIADEELVEATQAQAAANTEVASNPLPEAAAGSEPSAAAEAAPASTDAAGPAGAAASA